MAYINSTTCHKLSVCAVVSDVSRLIASTLSISVSWDLQLQPSRAAAATVTAAGRQATAFLRQRMECRRRRRVRHCRRDLNWRWSLCPAIKASSALSRTRVSNSIGPPDLPRPKFSRRILHDYYFTISVTVMYHHAQFQDYITRFPDLFQSCFLGVILGPEIMILSTAENQHMWPILDA